MTHSEEYERGRRDGRIDSLEASVRELSSDVKTMKIAIYMLYGAIALVQFMPDLKRALFGG